MDLPFESRFKLALGVEQHNKFWFYLATALTISFFILPFICNRVGDTDQRHPFNHSLTLSLIGGGFFSIATMLPAWLYYKSVSMTINTTTFSYPATVPESTYKYSDIQGFWILDTGETRGIQLKVENEFGSSKFSTNMKFYYMRFLLAHIAFACDYGYWCPDEQLELLRPYVDMPDVYAYLRDNYNHINFDFIDDNLLEGEG